jgi:nucleoid DNA-binding protein
MNKTQLVDALAERLGDRRTAAAAVDGLLETIVDRVRSGEQVALTGFGVFEGRARAARTARNPRTGVAVAVPALAAAFVAATAWRRAVLAGALLGLAVAAKFFALVLAPLAFLYVRGRAAWRGALAAAAAVVLVFGPFAVLAPGAIGNNLLNLVRRPLQIESLGASILLAAHHVGAYDPTVNSDYNSQNLGGALAAVVATASGLAGLAVIAAIVVAFARRPWPVERFFVACAAALTALVAFGKILSPQFLVWLVPLVALVPSAAAYGLLLAAMALTHVWFPSRYGQLVAFGDVTWVVLTRNVALLGLLAVLCVRLVRKRGPP